MVTACVLQPLIKGSISGRNDPLHGAGDELGHSPEADSPAVAATGGSGYSATLSARLLAKGSVPTGFTVEGIATAAHAAKRQRKANHSRQGTALDGAGPAPDAT
jgi:hypothetical protein